MTYYYQIRREYQHGRKLCGAGEMDVPMIRDLSACIASEIAHMITFPGDTLELSTEPFPEEEVLN